MSPNKPEEADVSKMNGHIYNDEKQNDSDKNAFPKKVYIRRNSLLTDLMEVNHLQSVYNISVAVCSLLFLSAVLYYLAEPVKFWQDISIMAWATGKFHYFVAIWLFLHVFAYSNYVGFKLWITVRNSIHPKIADGIFLLLYFVSTVLLFLVTPYLTWNFNLPTITAFATMNEQVRIFMKIYSFVRENVPRAMQYKSRKDGNQEYSLYPSAKYYFYYLFIPALIYKDSYPQTEKIRWENVFYNLAKFVAVIFITYCVFMRFNVDMFKNVGLQPFTKPEAALIFSGSMAVGAIMMFLLFYGLLHCWFNAFAELLKFGDRQFYQDWWNSTSFSQYYRRWNAVVYDWLYAYIYVDSHKCGCSRSVSRILVFIVSALVHEYIICVALGYFCPALLLTYSTIGIFVVFLTKQRTAQFWNTFMWGMLFSGWGVLVTCYSIEWFARINCPKEEETKLDFFIPRALDPSCQIINFS